MEDLYSKPLVKGDYDGIAFLLPANSVKGRPFQ
jgi:hypothetical protein